jgi:hypothetical protein
VHLTSEGEKLHHSLGEPGALSKVACFGLNMAEMVAERDPNPDRGRIVIVGRRLFSLGPFVLVGLVEKPRCDRSFRLNREAC